MTVWVCVTFARTVECRTAMILLNISEHQQCYDKRCGQSPQVYKEHAMGNSVFRQKDHNESIVLYNIS